MSQILVRNIDPDVVDKLKQHAKLNKRSLEAEVRDILEQAAREGHTPEFRKFMADLGAGRDKRLAFLDFVKERQRKSLPQRTDSAELTRQAREELDQKYR
jgi:plasmid stability protein